MSDAPAKNPKPLLNYLKLINQFWRLKRFYKLTSNESMLYLGLLDKCNSLNWKNPYKVSERYLSKALNISVNTLRKDRITLVEYGMIKYWLPEKASKSVEGSATYFIIENIPTASTTEAVEGDQDIPTASTTEAATASTTEAQPLQNPTRTASVVEANIKPSEKNLLKPSFYKDEIKEKYDKYELITFWNNVERTIARDPAFRGKNLSGNEYRNLLNTYFPEEIQIGITHIKNNYYSMNEAYDRLSIVEILENYLPKERHRIETTFTRILKDCDNLKQMKKQLSMTEKLKLNKTDFETLKRAFQTVNDNANYRKGESVFMAVENNLFITQKNRK